MSDIDIRKVVQEELNNIAPEVDMASVDPAFITAIHHRLGIDIPELDYPKLVTLNGAVAYIQAHPGSNKG